MSFRLQISDDFSGSLALAIEAGLQYAAAHNQQASVLAFGEWPRRLRTRSPSKDVRLIVVAGAAAILGACASFGEVGPFHRMASL